MTSEHIDKAMQSGRYVDWFWFRGTRAGVMTKFTGKNRHERRKEAAQARRH